MLFVPILINRIAVVRKPLVITTDITGGYQIKIIPVLGVLL